MLDKQHILHIEARKRIVQIVPYQFFYTFESKRITVNSQIFSRMLQNSGRNLLNVFRTRQYHQSGDVTLHSVVNELYQVGLITAVMDTRHKYEFPPVTQGTKLSFSAQYGQRTTLLPPCRPARRRISSSLGRRVMPAQVIAISAPNLTQSRLLC
nr:hypothetical protein [Marinobacterium rhizophilum]